VRCLRLTRGVVEGEKTLDFSERPMSVLMLLRRSRTAVAAIAYVVVLSACGGAGGNQIAGTILNSDTIFEPPASTSGFFGRVTDVEFGDTWHIEPADGPLTPGPFNGSTLGPATLTFEDGSLLYVPENTPGGNDCLQLISAAEARRLPGLGFDVPTQDCWLYGGLDETGDVSWFGIGQYEEGDSLVRLPEITAIRDGYATIAGVVELPLIPDDRSFAATWGTEIEIVAGKHALCGKGMSIGEWWPADTEHSTLVDIATQEVALVQCHYSY